MHLKTAMVWGALGMVLVGTTPVSAQVVTTYCADKPDASPFGEDPDWLSMAQGNGPQDLLVAVPRDPATATAAHLTFVFHDPNTAGEVTAQANGGDVFTGFGAANNANFSDRYFSFRQDLPPSAFLLGTNVVTVADTDVNSPLRLARACITLVDADPPATPQPEIFCAAVGGNAVSALALEYTDGNDHNAPDLDTPVDLTFSVDVPLGPDATLSPDLVVFIPGNNNDLTLSLNNAATTATATADFPGAASNDQRVATNPQGFAPPLLQMGTNTLTATSTNAGRLWVGCIAVDPGTPIDAGPPPVDAGPPPPDAGDAGLPIDAGLPNEDGGPAEVDAGRGLGLDAGPTPPVDAGAPDAGPPDAGAVDAGPLPDAGFLDAGVQDAGGGITTDSGLGNGGTPEEERQKAKEALLSDGFAVNGGCGALSDPGSVPLFLALLFLLGGAPLFRRRRAP